MATQKQIIDFFSQFANVEKLCISPMTEHECSLRHHALGITKAGSCEILAALGIVLEGVPSSGKLQMFETPPYCVNVGQSVAVC